jgi:hypothetical protein
LSCCRRGSSFWRSSASSSPNSSSW